MSTSDPHARTMHQPDGGLALSYNAQISTDAAQGLIAGVAVTQEPQRQRAAIASSRSPGTAAGEKAATEAGR